MIKYSTLRLAFDIPTCHLACEPSVRQRPEDIEYVPDQREHFKWASDSSEVKNPARAGVRGCQ